MFEARQFRDILIADLALSRGIAKSRDVAAALQRYWDEREAGASLAHEIARIAGLLPEALTPIERDVDRWIEEAQGDARRTLLLRQMADAALPTAMPTRAEDPGVPDIPLRPLSEARYRDFLPAGGGGMGIVYWALDSEMNRQVAFKVVRPEPEVRGHERPEPPLPLDLRPPSPNTPASLDFEHLKARFLQEAWITGGMEHPGIVPVYELGETPAGVPYYTMRFVRGSRTLASAMREVWDAPMDARLALLEPFLKVCDTMRYAHSKGVIHRDLKPENIAIGEYGEVVVIDWGLARLQDDDRDGKSRWQGRIESLHEAGELHETHGALGTPGYMAPEAALGLTDAVDERSDIYSLGAILYELLTGEVPFTAANLRELIARLTQEEAPPAIAAKPSVPQALSDLCARALQRNPEERPASVEAWVADLRDWQLRTQRERQVEDLRLKARTELETCENLEGENLLRQLERVGAVAQQLESLGADDGHVGDLRGEIDTLRERGIRSREASARRRAVRRLLGVGAAVAVVASVVFTGIFKSMQREADEARRVADGARQEAEQALADVRRLTASRSVRALMAEADDLWPLAPAMVPRMERWLADVDEYLAETANYKAEAAALEALLGEERSAEERRQVEVMEALVANLEAVAAEGGLRERIGARIHRARTLTSATRDHPDWPRVREEVRGSPLYAGLDLAPQNGLVPLGTDPVSKLQEFAFAPSGSIPTRNETGMLVTADDTAIVLVLLPAGRFLMGSQNEDASKPNYQPLSGYGEWPVHEIRFDTPPMFLAKHECTQAQWEALTEGGRPSGLDAVTTGITKRHPVERVSWHDCMTWATRNGLRLPSEIEWEYAARVGQSDDDYVAWRRGEGWDRLARHANLSDLTRKRSEKRVAMRGISELDDGFGVHAPVGSLTPNGLGLHDVLGNVREWVLDTHRGGERGLYPKGPLANPKPANVDPKSVIAAVGRGSAWTSKAEWTRISVRHWLDAGLRVRDLGWRPARDIER